MVKINKIIRNIVRCKKCNDVIESKNRHDFVWCKCKSIANDGGTDYQRLTWKEGKLEDYIDTSLTIYEDESSK